MRSIDVTRGPLPAFADPFLKNVVAGISRRRKAISHRGNLRISSDPNDTFEWITISCEAASRVAAVLQLWEKNRASLYLRSTKAKDRGKILARIEDMTLIDNGPWIVTAFERTISIAAGYTEGAELELDSTWDEVRLKSAQ